MKDREAIVPAGMEPEYEQMRIVEGSEAQIVQAFENLRHLLAAAE